ncbi:opioid growth factor receptor-like protein 1 [Amia ocellicauda]|uniref:opioid growth factor receptor-like protein 1 n=1 Tax=Amia ocellicauda TaxID=2972642 RepID=UPI003464BD16|nr:OGRL1 protein [Amia calva]
MGNLMGSLRYKEPSTVEECDSTWETDSDDSSSIPETGNPGDFSPCGDQDTPAPPQCADTRESSSKLKRSFYAAKDLYKYRHSYPNYKEPRQPSEYRNLRFYLNKIPLVPDGIYVEEILNKWKGDYEKLEHNHTYIQWLFPLREQGLNFYAQELTQDEIKEFQTTREAKRRFLLAYTVMLDFFGMKLLDKNGNVGRAANWQDRFQHLNESQHNYLRITRILKSLGELGFESFKPPLVRLLLEESLLEETVPNMKHSALEYFVYTIRDRKERRALLRFAQLHYRPAEQFIWGPLKKRKPGARTSSALEKNAAKSRPAKEPAAKIPSSPRVSGDDAGKAEGGGSDKPEEVNRAIPDGPPTQTEEKYSSKGERDPKDSKTAAENKAKHAGSCKTKPQHEGKIESKGRNDRNEYIDPIPV